VHAQNVVLATANHCLLLVSVI